MSTPQQHPLIGQVIAERYRVVELLAEGGMGAVYIAEHLTLHKEVALKVVHPEHAGNEELIARFAREAMATSRIDHPNVISAMDFGKLPDGTAYLAVQLVRGPSLTRVLKAERRLPWARAASIGAQIADALDAAHGHGIVHRDLKPDNVLLQYRDDGSELVKVLDFGVAKFAPESKVPLVARRDVTQVGMVVGTPGYMAPEQTIGNPADERADLYALGVILWEALVGQPLWNAPDLQGLVEKQMSETPKLVREATGNADIPEELEALIAELLARRAEERPSSAALVREALREHAAHNVPEFERPRWRTGARPVPSQVRSPPSSERPPSSKSTPPPAALPPAPALPALKAFPRPRLESVDDSAPTLIVEDMQLPAEAGLPTPTPTLRKPTVPPPPPPSQMMPTYRVPGRSSSRMAWLLSALLATILIAVVAAFAAGYFGLRGAPSVVHQPMPETENGAPAPDTRGEARADRRAVSAPGDRSRAKAPASAPPFTSTSTSTRSGDEASGSTGEAEVRALPPDDAAVQNEARPLTPDDVPRAIDNADELAAAQAVDAGAIARSSPAQKKAMYQQHVAKLQRFKTCEGKRTQIEALGALGDQRAVPVLKRLLGRPRTGCGKNRREDCFGCLRKPLAQALTQLGARPK